MLAYQQLKSAKKVVGIKQTIRAMEKDEIIKIYIAKDAESHVIQPVVEMCKVKGIEVINVDSMAELGRACAIKVGAAVVGVLK